MTLGGIDARCQSITYEAVEQLGPPFRRIVRRPFGPELGKVRAAVGLGRFVDVHCAQLGTTTLVG